MKKTCFYLCTLAICFFCSPILMAQTSLLVEYKDGEQFMDGLDDLGGFDPRVMDFNNDGKPEIIFRTGPVLVVRVSGNPNPYLLTQNDIGDPDYMLNNYRVVGFYDIAGDMRKELVLAPKPGEIGPVYVCSAGPDNHFTPEWFFDEADALFGFKQVYVQNMDGDPQAEIIVLINDPTGLGGGVTLAVYGAGFTPGFAGETPAESNLEDPSSSGMFMVRQVLPPNFRWPANRSFFPPGGRDLDIDGVPDITSIKFDGIDGEIIVISGDTHEQILNWDMSMGDLIDLYKRTAFYDFYGAGSKQVMFCSSNMGQELRDMEIILFLDPATGETNESLQPFLDNGFRAVSIFEVENDESHVIVMSHQVTGQVIIVGAGPGLQGGGDHEFGGSSDPVSDSETYTLNMIWESATTANLYMPAKKDFTLSDLDLNDDGTLDIPALVMQDSTSATLAGFYVFDGKTGDPIWQTPVSVGALLDPAANFRGFFDANGDGEKELFYGAETVQTADGTIQKPFSPGFIMEYIYDLNDDGFEEIIGQTPDGKIQVWSSSQVSATFEAQLNALGTVAIAPNPSAGRFAFSWNQQQAGQVSFDLFDERGVKVMQTQFGEFPAGEANHSIQLDESLPNGLYLGRICSDAGYSPVFLALQR